MLHILFTLLLNVYIGYDTLRPTDDTYLRIELCEFGA